MACSGGKHSAYARPHARCNSQHHWPAVPHTGGRRGTGISSHGGGQRRSAPHRASQRQRPHPACMHPPSDVLCAPAVGSTVRGMQGRPRSWLRTLDTACWASALLHRNCAVPSPCEPTPLAPKMCSCAQARKQASRLHATSMHVLCTW
jgi:hypothetical protein